MEELIVKNPYSGDVVGKVPYATPSDIRDTLGRATRAFQSWRHSRASDRAELLDHAAQILESQREEFVDLIQREAGKPVSYARVEFDRALAVLRWASAETQRFAGELLRLDISSNGRPGFGIHQRFARGVVLGITPFNFPLNLVCHKVAPALASGCPIIIKPSPATPLTALKFAGVFASLDHDLFQVLIADDQATADLTRAPEIAQISFTGSSHVGWTIRKQAPEKPTLLELGGNAWAIVLESTKREHFSAIAKRLCGAGFGYAGQSCISVQNVAVAQPIYDDFAQAMIKATEVTRFGNPVLDIVTCGPMIHSHAAEKVREMIAKAPPGSQVIASSAMEKGGEPAPDPKTGTLVPPMLVVMPVPYDQMDLPPLVQDECFGPIINISSFESLPALVGKINSSRYGLQAGVYTQNLATIESLYRDLDVGGLVVNDVPTTRYDHQPYGGNKDSGQGREGVRYAMEEFTVSKFLALSSHIPGI